MEKRVDLGKFDRESRGGDREMLRRDRYLAQEVLLSDGGFGTRILACCPYS